jgi:hypothetical protein
MKLNIHIHNLTITGGAQNAGGIHHADLARAVEQELGRRLRPGPSEGIQSNSNPAGDIARAIHTELGDVL